MLKERARIWTEAAGLEVANHKAWGGWGAAGMEDNRRAWPPQGQVAAQCPTQQGATLRREGWRRLSLLI